MGAEASKTSGTVEAGSAELALLSVWDKTGLVELGQSLSSLGYDLVGSGGTAKRLSEAGLAVRSVESVTGAAEMLGGRVKTLHPAIHGGILARGDSDADTAELAERGISKVAVVVANLYPFEQTVAKPDVSLGEAIENIDIGGVTLLRAAAKNKERVIVLCDPADYDAVVAEMSGSEDGRVSEKTRARLALKAFEMTAAYDSAICSYLRGREGGRLPLRYGMNPHQDSAALEALQGWDLPLSVLSGTPGYINLLDALNGWALVSELSAALDGRAAAASFKHVSPAGAAVGVPLSAAEASACMVEPEGLSELATAYARARGADRLSSFGDFVALSHPCDVSTARLLKAEVSDGVIAPGYEAEALELLRAKKGGKYCVLQIDPAFQPSPMEERSVFGLRLTQRRNDARISREMFQNSLTAGKEAGEAAIRDLIVATVAVKYAQSNSVALALNGQIIGIGAGQQSRVHCTRLAGEKAQHFWLRQHVALRGLPFREGLSRAEKTNAVDGLIRLRAGEEGSAEWRWAWAEGKVPSAMEEAVRRPWLASLSGVALSSDAFFPFPDNVHLAAELGCSFIASPGGSSNDEAVIQAAQEHGMALFHTRTRLFHH